MGFIILPSGRVSPEGHTYSSNRTDSLCRLSIPAVHRLENSRLPRFSDRGPFNAAAEHLRMSHRRCRPRVTRTNRRAETPLALRRLSGYGII